MMDQRQQTNIGNFMFHAMRMWPECRVHWLVQQAIDSPAMWIEDDMWDAPSPVHTRDYCETVCIGLIKTPRYGYLFQVGNRRELRFGIL